MKTIKNTLLAMIVILSLLILSSSSPSTTIVGNLTILRDTVQFTTSNNIPYCVEWEFKYKTNNTPKNSSDIKKHNNNLINHQNNKIIELYTNIHSDSLVAGRRIYKNGFFILTETIKKNQ